MDAIPPRRPSADDSDNDSFYNVGVTDLKIMMRDLKTQVAGLDDKPFLTGQMRELEDNKKTLLKLQRYKTTIIRIQFPDRLVLQANFSPIDTIGTVMAFIRNYLADTNIDFYLCKLCYACGSPFKWK